MPYPQNLRPLLLPFCSHIPNAETRTSRCHSFPWRGALSATGCPLVIGQSDNPTSSLTSSPVLSLLDKAIKMHAA